MSDFYRCCQCGWLCDTDDGKPRDHRGDEECPRCRERWTFEEVPGATKHDEAMEVQRKEAYRRSPGATIDRLTKERDEARGEVERLKLLVAECDLERAELTTEIYKTIEGHQNARREVEALRGLLHAEDDVARELAAIREVLDNAPTPRLNNDRTPSTLAERVEWLVWAWREADDSHAVDQLHKLERAYEALLSQTRWIPVEERLPELTHGMSEDVLAWSIMDPRVVFYDCTGDSPSWGLSATGGGHHVPVTHWKPLDKPPSLPDLLTSVADRADEMARRLFGDGDGGGE